MFCLPTLKLKNFNINVRYGVTMQALNDLHYKLSVIHIYGYINYNICTKLYIFDFRLLCDQSIVSFTEKKLQISHHGYKFHMA